jgi:hypothetical protein
LFWLALYIPCTVSYFVFSFCFLFVFLPPLITRVYTLRGSVDCCDL